MKIFPSPSFLFFSWVLKNRKSFPYCYRNLAHSSGNRTPHLGGNQESRCWLEERHKTHHQHTTTFSFCFSHFKILKARIIPQRRTLSPFFHHLPPSFPLCFVLHITFRPFDYTCRLLNRRPVLGSHCYAHRLIHFPKREGIKKKERRLTGLEQ